MSAVESTKCTIRCCNGCATTVHQADGQQQQFGILSWYCPGLWFSAFSFSWGYVSSQGRGVGADFEEP